MPDRTSFGFLSGRPCRGAYEQFSSRSQPGRTGQELFDQASFLLWVDGKTHTAFGPSLVWHTVAGVASCPRNSDNTSLRRAPRSRVVNQERTIQWCDKNKK